jgi:hypothetical protein
LTYSGVAITIMSMDEMLLTFLEISATTIGALMLFIMKQISDDLKNVARNIALLNERMAVIVERVDSHEGRLRNLEHL